MANLLRRIKDSISADIHTYLDERERKNPLAMVNLHLRHCEKEIEKVEISIKNQKALSHQLSKEKKEIQAIITKRTRQCELAKKANELELEARGREEAELFQYKLEQIEERYEKVEREIQLLQKQLEDMNIRLKEMKIKQADLKNRENME